MTIAGLTEVQLGKIATERAASADVKAFGQMMVKDHSQAGDELKQVASQLRIQPTTQLDQKHKDLVDKLSKLQGAEFDREYINAMAQGHQEVLGKVRARVEAKVPAPGAAAGEHPVGARPADDARAGGGSPGRDSATGKPPAQMRAPETRPAAAMARCSSRSGLGRSCQQCRCTINRARELQKTLAK